MAKKAEKPNPRFVFIPENAISQSDDDACAYLTVEAAADWVGQDEFECDVYMFSHRIRVSTALKTEVIK